MMKRKLFIISIISLFLLSCKKDEVEINNASQTNSSGDNYYLQYANIYGKIYDSIGKPLSNHWIALIGTPCQTRSKIKGGNYSINVCELISSKHPYHFPKIIELSILDSTATKFVGKVSFPSDVLVIKQSVQVNFQLP